MTHDPRRSRQLDLFAPAAATDEAAHFILRRPRPAVVPLDGAEVPASLADVAGQFPSDIYLGTSSWSFPGWAGIVYSRAAAPHELARHGLAAYARHPLLRAVGIDRTFYAPLAAADFTAYAQAVPDYFRFLVKAHEQCTWIRFPRLARYGNAAGQRNSLFLDAAYAAELVIGPMVDGLGSKAGPLVFQFPPQPLDAIGGPRRFIDRLQRFLEALPRGPLYAVEIRNADLLTPAYAAALAATGACHCATVHPTMPDVATQVKITGTNPALVVRWMLGGRQGYEEARTRYQPFDQIVDADPRTRDTIARLSLHARAAHRRAFVIINNKAEGSAPLSAFSLATRIVELM